MSNEEQPVAYDSSSDLLRAVYEWRRDEYILSTDVARIDLAMVHGFLTTSYWAAGVSLDTVRKSIAHSLVFGIYRGQEQVGFSRIITDFTTYAYVADVFVLDAYRGQGLAHWMMECVIAHPELQGLRLWTLFTRDAHGLYEKVGFRGGERAERLMIRLGLQNN